MLKKDDPKKQMVYYQTGIGTNSSADARFSLVRNTTQTLDSMFAITLGTHVLGQHIFIYFCIRFSLNECTQMDTSFS